MNEWNSCFVGSSISFSAGCLGLSRKMKVPFLSTADCRIHSHKLGTSRTAKPQITLHQDQGKPTNRATTDPWTKQLHFNQWPPGKSSVSELTHNWLTQWLIKSVLIDSLKKTWFIQSFGCERKIFLKSWGFLDFEYRDWRTRPWFRGIPWLKRIIDQCKSRCKLVFKILNWKSWNGRETVT